MFHTQQLKLCLNCVCCRYCVVMSAVCKSCLLSGREGGEILVER